jgi:hypothetical protein
MSHPEWYEQRFKEAGGTQQALPASFHQNISLLVGTRFIASADLSLVLLETAFDKSRTR